jgi:hypothetical protein
MKLIENEDITLFKNLLKLDYIISIFIKILEKLKCHLFYTFLTKTYGEFSMKKPFS